MPWLVEFYEEEDGSRPVEEFLESLPLNDRARLDQRIQLLKEFGPTLDDPYTSQVEGKLRELKAQVGRTHYRILYYGDPQRTFILLHALIKRTEKLAEQDIAIARKRMQKRWQGEQKGK